MEVSKKRKKRKVDRFGKDGLSNLNSYPEEWASKMETFSEKTMEFLDNLRVKRAGMRKFIDIIVEILIY